MYISNRKCLKFRTKNARDCTAYMGGGIEMSSDARVNASPLAAIFKQIGSIFFYSCATDVEWWNELTWVENHFVCFCYQSYKCCSYRKYAFNIIKVWSFKTVRLNKYMNWVFDLDFYFTSPLRSISKTQFG